MRRLNRWLFVIAASFMVTSALASTKPFLAQSNTTILSIAVPSLMKDNFSQNVIDGFESANPGVKLNIIPMDASITTPTSDLKKHFDSLQQYVSAADVLFVNNNILTVEATRAGYFLDLGPLATEDKNLHPDDFFPAIWQSYQWDKGTWALPAAATPYVLTYQPSAFDKLGLAYPSEKWTMDDLATAVSKLAVKDQSGAVTGKGIDVADGYSAAVLFRSLIGENLYDAGQVPFVPQINKPAAQTVLDSWLKLDQANLLGDGINRSPLGIGPMTTLLVQDSNNPDQKRSAVLLPGGKAGLEVQAYAVSKGTQYPEKAFALAAYLTTRPEMATFLSIVPARKSLAGADSSAGLKLTIPAELQPVVQQALDNALPVSDVLFTNYLVTAWRGAKRNNTDAQTAIVAAAQSAQDNVKAAASQKDSVNVVVATPIPQGSGSDKITLNFGFQTVVRPLPNADAWSRVIADFTAKDPQVGRVNLNLPLPIVLFDQYADKYDCFYLTNNFVPEINIGKLLNLDPYADADKSFDKGDVVGNFMQLLTRDNKLWALPGSLQPAILQYDATQFSKAGLPAPTYGWTIDAFINAVKTIKTDPSQPEPFVSAGTGGTHLLLLIAAYGGLPIDYRTNPPTFHYTEPDTVAAIQQVLDLAKKGYIKYVPIGTLTPTFVRPSNSAIINIVLNAYTLRINNGNQMLPNYKPVTYPKGSQYTALSFTLGTLYISKNAQNPEACYRWISEVSKHPELFSSMPVRKSQINDPNLAATQGNDTIALYNQVEKLIEDPNTIYLPSLEGAQRSFFHQYWLFKAFDNYVLKDANLESVLKDAEDKSNALIQCVAKIPALDNTDPVQAQQYFKAYSQCVVKIDPSFTVIFSLFR